MILNVSAAIEIGKKKLWLKHESKPSDHNQQSFLKEGKPAVNIVYLQNIGVSCMYPGRLKWLCRRKKNDRNRNQNLSERKRQVRGRAHFAQFMMKDYNPIKAEITYLQKMVVVVVGFVYQAKALHIFLLWAHFLSGVLKEISGSSSGRRKRGAKENLLTCSRVRVK